MEDTIVSFETAKLLKEKGINILTIYWYHKNTKNILCEADIEIDFISNEDVIPAPTLSLAQKWLREVYKLHITIDLTDSWEFTIVKNESFTTRIDTQRNFNSYELALEQGILESLKLIK